MGLLERVRGGGYLRGGEGEGRNRGLWYSQTALIRTLRELNNSLPRKAGGCLLEKGKGGA